VLQAYSSIGNLPTPTTENRIPSLAAYAHADQSDGTQVSQADPLTLLHPPTVAQRLVLLDRRAASMTSSVRRPSVRVGRLG
jgi:hypothetical protein